MTWLGDAVRRAGMPLGIRVGCECGRFAISRKEAFCWHVGYGNTRLFRREAGKFDILRIRHNSFAFVALLARVKPGKFYGEPRYGGCVPSGRISFRDFSKGFPGPHSESGGNCAFSFPSRNLKQRVGEV